MKILRSIPVVALLAATACGGDSWYEGTFVGTTTKGIRYTVSNEKVQKFIGYEDSAGIGCSAMAAFSVRGNTMIAETTDRLCQFAVTLKRVNDDLAEATLEGEVVAMRKH